TGRSQVLALHGPNALCIDMAVFAFMPPGFDLNGPALFPQARSAEKSLPAPAGLGAILTCGARRRRGPCGGRGKVHLSVSLPPRNKAVLSTRSSGQDAEEGFDVRVSPDISVAVEVGGAGAGRDGAGAGETGEERLDVGVCAHVAIAVKVGRAASACDSHEVGGVVKVEPTHVLAPGVAAEAPGGSVEARGGGTARGECASREVDPAHVLSPGK